MRTIRNMEKSKIRRRRAVLVLYLSTTVVGTVLVLSSLVLVSIISLRVDQIEN